MATKQTLDIPERKQQPSVEDFDVSVDFRIRTERAWDAKDPAHKHLWQRCGTPPELLTRKRQEAVLENGKPIEDPMGDFLVRTPRELYDALRERDAKMSLEEAKAVRGTDPRSQWETDLEQIHQPKKQKQD